MKYRPKLKISLKKVLNIGISPRFWLIREGNDICNIHSKLQSIKFSKWWLLIFSGGNHPSYPPSLTVHLTPRRDFFHQNDRKGCIVDYIDCLGHFLFGFGATGKNLEGVVTTLLGGWGLNNGYRQRIAAMLKPTVFICREQWNFRRIYYL